MTRRLLGTASNLVTRVRVYLAADAVEIDEIEGYSGTRKRVLFDEVLLLTLDRRRRLGSVLMWGGCGTAFMMPALIASIGMRSSVAGLAIAAACGGPFWIGLLVHLAFGVDQVTVFGKRTTAQIRFSLRKRRAREIFALLRDRVREAQRAAVAVEAQPVAPLPATDAGGTAAA